MNTQQQWDQWDEFVETIDTVMAESGIRSRMDAADEVRRRYPHLRNAKYPGKPGMMGTSSSGGRPTGTPMGGSAEAQLNVLAKQMAVERRCTLAQAYVEVLKANPNLYIAYLKQKQAEMEVASRSR